MKLFNSYWELRELLKNIVPRKSILESLEKNKGIVKEKGRKINYQEFDFESGSMKPVRRLLNKEEIKSFIEISSRAPYCPMPVNADIYDSMICPYNCLYCFATSYKSSLYTSFFDNSREIGIRKAPPTFFRPELDKLMKNRGKKIDGPELPKAISLQIPVRLGIRYEDFLPIESKLGISLDFMKYFTETSYPLMVNTKSALIGDDKYVRVLSDNKAGAAVHITMISSDDLLNEKLEPGAPPFAKRIQAAKALTDAGVRVVARIEPFMIFINDEKEQVDYWINEVWNAGIRNITFDTYSFSASAPGVARQMEIAGFDFDRMFLLMSDSQWLGSLIVGEFIKYLKSVKPFSASTFDFGNVPMNNQLICCECEDAFSGSGFSYGNNLIAIRYIKSLSPNPVTWDSFDNFVISKGGWLSESLREAVRWSWNLSGNSAYFLNWGQGIELYGVDRVGNRVWKYVEASDFRLEMLKGVVE